MYSISDYAGMIADRVRVHAYAGALRRTVNADSIVVDIGTGIGTFALLACRFGARKVYAIEPSDAIHVGRAIAAASGLSDRIEFIQAVSTDVTLPDRADVIVSDIHGALPLFGRHIPSIADARTRLLAEDGILIPRRDRLWAAVADAPDIYTDHVEPWGNDTYGLDLRPLRDMLASRLRRHQLASDQLLSAPRCLATLDYRELQDPDLDTEATWTARRIGTAHGLCLWFDTELADGIGFSNAPGQPETIAQQGFFPFAAPVGLDAGESMRARIQAALVGDGYVWQWTTRFCKRHETDDASISFKQSTLNAVPLAATQLQKSSAGHVPTLTSEGEIDLFILSRMQAATPLGDIARDALARFPGALRDWNAALGRVGDLSRKYSKD